MYGSHNPKINWGESMDNFFLQALTEVLNFETIFLIFVGTVFGIIAGAIPGFSITMAILLTFPFTFAMDPINGVALMIGVFVGGFSGGLVSGIMLGIPGTPSSVATTFDGYPMAKNGEPGRALGIGVFSSFIGTLISIIMLVTIGPMVARFSLNFGPWEITALIVFTLTLVASLSQGAMLKGLISAGFGLLIATVGVDINGKLRFDFGIDSFAGGFAILPVMIGVFAFSQLMDNVQEIDKNRGFKDKISKINTKIRIPYLLILKDMWKQKGNLLRSSLIGSLIGSLPAAGGAVANFVSYDQARKFSKYPEKFGKGIPDGIVASEASNSAVTGGAFIPTLTLGIPGDLPMAIMMGVLILHGIRPGPLLFQQQPVLVGSIYVSLFVAAVVMLIAQFVLMGLFTKIARVPQAILVPVILMLCGTGSYALNSTLFDVWSLYVFGIIGFLLAKSGVPLSPLILGLVLGYNLEAEMFRALQLDPSWTTFFTRPISAVLFLIALLSVIFSIIQTHKVSKKLKESNDTRAV
jgi:putative tricarboxylic transport membrane protein